MNITYLDENLHLGKWGHIAVITAFVFAILSSVSYYFSVEGNESEKEGWRKIGRWTFFTHATAILGLVVVLFIMLFNHHYEYFYVWKHSNNAMPLRYIFSCFWEGQEGSFLLWAIWHVVLGGILCFTAKKWEAPVMAIVAAVQVFLTSMLLGIQIPTGPYTGLLILTIGLFVLFVVWNKLKWVERITIGTALLTICAFIISKDVAGFQIGSSPFTVLMREHPKYGKEGFFLNPNYLHAFDGNGLNPLLQNYWMTIHPPMLFLGFASTLIPFAFAISGLWTKRLNEWMTPALPWIFFGVAALGVGILMGGAWAYEALSFGGFWAWDPVENASLFPWLTFVGAAHVMIVQRKKGKSSYITFVLTLLTFLLVLYSTYLTRSGILGDTSVHSFADGMPGQLLIYLFFFVWITGFLLLQNNMLQLLFTVLSLCFLVIQFYVADLKIISIVSLTLCIALFVFSYLKYFPKDDDDKNESLSSREFWMFIAAIVLLMSCIQILFATSIPVINKIFGTSITSNPDIFEAYVKYQILFGFVICLMMGVGLYFKYKHSPWKKLLKDISISFFITSLLCLIVAFSYRFKSKNDISRLVVYWVFFFASTFAIVANVNYFIIVLKGKLKASGAPIAHLGFAMIMFGAFFSTSQSEVISENTMLFDLEKASGNELKNNENVFMSKGDTLPMGNYYVTYHNSRTEGANLYFDVDYLKRTDSSFVKEFSLSPFLQTNERMGNVAEPATKHFAHKDIYTHLQAYNTPKKNYYQITKGDTLHINDGYIHFKDVVLNVKNGEGKDSANYKSIKVGSVFETHLPQKENEEFIVYQTIEGKKINSPETTVNSLKSKIKLVEINHEKGYFVFEINNHSNEYIIMKAIEFPLINILWAGCIIMVLGTIIAIIHRIRMNKINAYAQ